MNKVKNGFTLAEVLITLAIIGVVAAMTIPTLTSKYQKMQTVNKVKHFYSTMSQAVMMSEIDNGIALKWDTENLTPAEVVEKYIAPYVKVLNCSQEDGANNAMCQLGNGTTLVYTKVETTAAGQIANFTIFINGKRELNSRNHFIFNLYSKDGITQLRPFGMGGIGVTRTRDEIKQGATGFCCSNECTDWRAHYNCSALIMYDGWKISDDYPW